MTEPLKTIHLDEPITANMRQNYVRLDPAESVGEAVERLRQSPPEERIVYFYAVDHEGVLRGVVSARDLLLSTPDRHIADILIQDVVALPAAATVLEACEFFIQHRLLALPVVDSQRRLLGVVDVQLYTDELDELHRVERRDDLFQMIGVHAEGPPASPWRAFGRRFPWLSCNLAGGLLAAVLSGLFEETLARVVALALFIPVVLNLAESVSSQSVSLTLHLLGGRRPSWRTVLRPLRGEAVTGLLLGVASGLVVALMALVWRGDWRVAVAVLGGIAVGVAVSALLGGAIPLLLRLLRLDPRVAAGPIALASADVVTILAYFNLAHALVG